MLRFIFLDPRARAAHYDWESMARLVLGAFRLDAARAGAAADVEPLVDDLCRRSPEFKAMWRDHDIPGPHGEVVKHLRHPKLGPIAFEVSAFAVDGRTDLSLLVYNPATPADAERIASLLEPRYPPMPPQTGQAGSAPMRTVRLSPARRVVDQQAAGQGLAGAGDQLDRLQRHHRADHAGQRPDHPDRGAGLGVRRDLGHQAAVAGPAGEHADLAGPAADGAARPAACPRRRRRR